MTDFEEGDTLKMDTCPDDDNAAVQHFLELNGLLLLKFRLPKDRYDRSRTLYRSIPLYIKNRDLTSTVVFVDRFLYDPEKQILTVRAEEVLKQMRTPAQP